ncbi:hypothetical protein [Stutzerimonas stutzeri]|uniref:Uncharacterized protein n=1 Tax=Stutzerimonas stutzeri TaxID=316 RepID=A0AA40V7U0_STUST|nr:hypothetical protein [Stutzerimonas stutzeri]MBA1306176.1 hypothetical protein [Stutzerimonas stutzeri]
MAEISQEEGTAMMDGHCELCRERCKPFSQRPRKQQIAVIVAVTIFFGMIINLPPNSPFSDWLQEKSREEKVELIGQRMSVMADAGRPEAVIWMARHFPDVPERRKALESLASSGHGEALLLLAVLTGRTDPAKAQRFIAKAAEAGNPEAVLAVARNPERYK